MLRLGPDEDLPGRVASVDGQGHARDPARLVGREEEGGVRDVARLAEEAERVLIEELLPGLALRPHPVEHRAVTVILVMTKAAPA